LIATTEPLTTVKTISPSSTLSVGGIIGITIGLLIIVGIFMLVIRAMRKHQKNILDKTHDSTNQLIPVSATIKQYRLTTRAVHQTTSKVSKPRTSVTINNNLVSIES
jgi:competence protein ComGC